MPSTLRPDAARDLVLERVVDVPRELVWRAWTVPEHVKRWFTPLPWTTVECEIDLRPGGIFRTVMRSPEGQDFPNLGCYLEIVKEERLVWTTALAPGYRPASNVSPSDQCGVGFFITAVITLESAGKGTKYTALAMHGDEEGRKNHERLGFHDGWGTALDQLVAHARAM
ncbi:MAG: SRPBCC family protein [Casimicrobiaceae bacterium]|jgi:uncharacterized protein YndB with AHSA1/START domain